MERLTSNLGYPWEAINGQPAIIPQIGVVVGIPSSRLVAPEWAIALAVQAWPSSTNTCYVPIHCGNPRTGTVGPPRDKARELIVEAAQKLKAPFIAMLDDDVEIPYGAFRQLYRTIKEAPEDVVMVGGVYPEKNDTRSPIIYQDLSSGPFWRWKKGQILDVPLIGTGVCIFRTSVFERLDKPWFKDVNEPQVAITDDAWFCMKARRAGYRILADTNVICAHWDYEHMIKYEIPPDSYPFQPDNVEPYAIVGQGENLAATRTAAAR